MPIPTPTPARSPRAAGQRGATTVLVTLLLCGAMLLAVAFAHRHLVVEQRMATNLQRAAQAFDAAESGLAWAQSMLNQTRAVGSDCRPLAAPAGYPFGTQRATVAGEAACVRTDSGWACHCPVDGPATLPASDTGDRSAFRLQFTPGARPGLLEAVAIGCSRADACRAGAPAEAEARSRQLWARLPALARAPAAALTARGRIDAGTAALGVHNADPASGGWTLHAGGEVLAPAARLAAPAGSPPHESIAANDGTLASRTPERWFAAHLGLDKASWRALPALQRLACDPADCSAALQQAQQDADGSAPLLLQVAGDLRVEQPVTIGTPERPVVLVVDGDVHWRGAVALHGLLYARALTWRDAEAPAARLRGAALLEMDYQGNAAADLVRDADILTRLQRDGRHWVPVPGSWRDF